MKVLLVDVNFIENSTGKLLFDIYEHINSADNTCYVAYGRGKKRKMPNVYKFGLDFETLIHTFLTRITGLTGCFSFLSTRRLIRYIKKIKPDVVHLHELHGYFVNINKVLNFLNKKKYKTILTLHSEFMYTGKCGYSNGCKKWKTECKHCEHLSYYPKTYLDFTKYMFNRKKDCLVKFDNLYLTVVSKWLYYRVKESFLNRDKLFIVNNGINTDIFNKNVNYNDLYELYNIPRNTKIVLSVATNILSQEKGGPLIREVASRIKNENVMFLLVGTDNQLESGMNNVKYLGNIYDEVILSKIYSLADCFLICSKNETYSLPCAEALCCGTNVVGFKCGAPEMIFDSSVTTFVEYGNFDALIIELRNKLNNPVEVSNEIVNNLSSKKMLINYLDLYNKII